MMKLLVKTLVLGKSIKSNIVYSSDLYSHVSIKSNIVYSCIFMYRIVFPSRTFHIYANSNEDCDQWVELLSSKILVCSIKEHVVYE